MAHVEKRQQGAGGAISWRARYRDPSGRERSRSFTRKADATAWLAEQQTRMARGDWIDPEMARTTVAELGERLLATKLDRNNRVWYRSALVRVNDAWGDHAVVELEHTAIQTWLARLEAAGVGPDGVRAAYRALNELCGLALRARMITYNPCPGVSLPAVRRREMLFLTAVQVDMLAGEIETMFPGAGWGVLVRFAAYSGLRAGEVAGLQVRHLDLLGRRVQVVAARKSYGVDGEPKGGRKRWVDLPAQLCDALGEHLAGRDHRPEARVWTGEGGDPLNHQWFYKHRFRAAVEELTGLGLLPTQQIGGRVMMLRFHDLRHTCVALLVAKGCQQYEVMAHLGHTNIATTINTYGHLFPAVRDRIRDALEDTWVTPTTAAYRGLERNIPRPIRGLDGKTPGPPGLAHPL